jgi:phosphomannomutase
LRVQQTCRAGADFSRFRFKTNKAHGWESRSGIITALGHDIVDIGIVPTPVVLFGVKNGEYAGGIVITASHNPVEWNALKLVNGDGKFLSPEQFGRLQDFYADITASGSRQGVLELQRYDRVGTRSFNKSIPADHHRELLDYIDSDLVRGSDLSIVVDTVNGAGGPHTIGFLEELGCRVIPIHTEPTGIFCSPARADT